MNKELDIAEKNQPQNVEMERFSHARVVARKHAPPGLNDYLYDLQKIEAAHAPHAT